MGQAVSNAFFTKYLQVKISLGFVFDVDQISFTKFFNIKRQDIYLLIFKQKIHSYIYIIFTWFFLFFSSGYHCGGKGNLDVATSIIYWSDWIQNMLSIYNLRGSRPPTRRNKVQSSKCYSGTSVRELLTSNAARCCDACRSNAKCKAWTWKSSKICSLMASRGSVSVSNDCLSGYY